MGIVYQHDKRSGITYAYESQAHWDKETKNSKAKRTLIGRVDPQSGEIVPTDGRVRKAAERKQMPAETDYKSLYEKLLDKCASQEVLIGALQKEIRTLKERL